MMKNSKCGWGILFALLACSVRPPMAMGQQTAGDSQAVEHPLGGFPIATTRRHAIAADLFHRDVDAATIRNWMQLSSRCTIAEFELFVAPLSSHEKQLLQVIERMPAPIVNRLHFGHLRSVLQNGGIIALELEREARGGKVPHTTSGVENELFGAFDCVFASVGPPHGTPRYGDVIIRLKDAVRERGWATPFSGMYFLSHIRGKDAAAMQTLLSEGKTLPTGRDNPLSLGFDDRLHYSHYIVTEGEWNRALAYQAILTLRNAGDTAGGERIRQRVGQILDEEDPVTFWSLFIPAREQGLSPTAEAARLPLGYLEAKFPGRVGIEDFTSIEVPADKLAEVQGWPEAKPYLRLIRARPEGVD